MRALFGVCPLLTAAVLLTVGVAAAEPTRSGGLLAENTPWENPYFIVDSGVEGPALMITAGLHGNEPAGYRATEQIRHWPVRRGRLIVVPRVNTPGLRQNTRWLPDEPEATRNANRNFPKTGEPNEARTVPVKAVWQLIQRQKPDWIVDLHEGYDFHVANPKSDGSSIIYFDRPPMQEIAAEIQAEVNAGIEDPKRKIVRLSGSGPAGGGLVRAAVERVGAKGFCFETTYQKQRLSTRTRQHRIMVHSLMRQLDMAAGDANVMIGREPSAETRVAVYDAQGASDSAINNLRKLFDWKPRWGLRWVGAADVRGGVLDQFDVVVFPGGSGSKQAQALGPEGRRAVQQFVHGGGGYVGICAGAYLATAKYDWGLALVNAKTFTGKRDVPGAGMKSMGSDPKACQAC